MFGKKNMDLKLDIKETNDLKEMFGINEKYMSKLLAVFSDHAIPALHADDRSGAITKTMDKMNPTTLEELSFIFLCLGALDYINNGGFTLDDINKPDKKSDKLYNTMKKKVGKKDGKVWVKETDGEELGIDESFPGEKMAAFRLGKVNNATGETEELIGENKDDIKLQVELVKENNDLMEGITHGIINSLDALANNKLPKELDLHTVLKGIVATTYTMGYKRCLQKKDKKNQKPERTLN